MKLLLSGQIPMGEHTVDVHIESTVYDLKTEIEDKIGLDKTPEERNGSPDGC